MDPTNPLNPRKRILMISYYYPPLTDVGGLRALGFSKYLPEYGWEPYVLSVKNPDKGYCSLGNDNPPPGVKVFHSWSIINIWRIIGKLNALVAGVLKLFGKKLQTNVIANLFSIPDIFIGWIPLSVIKGLRIIRKYKIDVIYVSCKPFSSSLIGVFLKKVTRKPLIVELRDPTIFFLSVDNSLSYRINVKGTEAIEKFVLEKVDKLIFVTKETEEKYLSRYTFLKDKTSCIYNGFFSEFLPEKQPKAFDTFTIIYIGNYYVGYRDSELLFQALQKIISRKTIQKDNIKFLYLGDNIDWFKLMREKYGLHDVVMCTGKVSRKESIEALYKSAVIYLRIVNDSISTKLFEGLSTGNPFLSAITNTEVIGILDKYSPHSMNTTPHDTDALAEAIETLYSQWGQGKLKKRIDEEYLSRFDKRSLTKELAIELNALNKSYNHTYHGSTIRTK